MKANLTALAALLCLGISVGVDAVAPSDAWDEARRILDDGVESRVFPGASALVGGRDGVLFQHSTGRLTYGEQPPHGSNEVVSQDTVFDLASLSKVVGTTSVVAWLYEKGYLDLGDLVSSETLLGPAFAQNGKGAITLEDCMLHQAGFPPDPSPNYWDPKFGCPGAPLPADQTFACSQKSYDSLMSQSLDSSPGERYVYSDLSMITMMFVAGQIIRRNALVSQVFLLPECADYPNSTAVQLQCHFEAFLRARIVPEIAWSSQQGMSVLGYRLHSFVWSRTAPTETVAASGLNVTLQGRVEDGNCEMLGGVSGHAGIFSTTRDLSALMHTLVFPGVAMDGTPAPHVFLNATTLSLFTTERNHAISSRALGWNTNDPSVTDEGWNLSCLRQFEPEDLHALGLHGDSVAGPPSTEEDDSGSQSFSKQDRGLRGTSALKAVPVQDAPVVIAAGLVGCRVGMLKSRKVAGLHVGKGRGRLALRRIFLILVLLCLGLVTANFLCNHPFEIDIVSDAAPDPSPPPPALALSKESDGDDFHEQIGGDLGVDMGTESIAGARDGQGGGGLGSPAGDHPGSPSLLAPARPKARSPAQTYRSFQRKGGRTLRKDKEKSRVLHEQHHRKIAETWANLLIKTSFSANVTDVCSPRYFGDLRGGGEASVAVSSETMSQVRTCVRAVICTLDPWDRDQMQHNRVSSVVSDKTKINANILELQEVIHEELSHVLDEEMLHYARAIFRAQRQRDNGAGESKAKAEAKADAKAEAPPAEPRSQYDEVQRHALKSWIHRDSAATTKKSKEYQKILDQSKPYFRACKVGIPLLTHKQLFEDAGETIGEGALRSINFTTFGKVGSIQHSVRFPSEIFELIPDVDDQWGYQTCAVVDNNAVNAKRSAGLGEKIDSNEAVIRSNHAPFHGYENLVGSKATFDVVSMDHARDLAMGKGVPARIRLEASKMIVIEAHTPNISQHLSLEILEQFSPKSYYHVETLLLSPQFSRFVQDLWENLWDDLESVGFISRSVDVDRTRPTVEFISVLFALQVCDHVHLYGFRSTPTPRTYWNKDLESPYSVFHVKVAAILIKHMAIWPNRDAYRAITLHK